MFCTVVVQSSAWCLVRSNSAAVKWRHNFACSGLSFFYTHPYRVLILGGEILFVPAQLVKVGTRFAPFSAQSLVCSLESRNFTIDMKKYICCPPRKLNFGPCF